MEEFVFKKQIGKRGYYCTIFYEIELLEFKYEKVYFDIHNPWFAAVTFASNYFFQKFSGFKNRGYKLRIHDIHTMIIDTSPMVVFYTTIMLLSHATGYIVSDLELNERGDLILPK